MAHELGISKKTLVGIEKGRSSLGWTGSAALCLLFGDSQTLKNEVADDPAETAAHLRARPRAPRGTGEAVPPGRRSGSPIWRRVAVLGELFAEQNVISEHYRLIDRTGRRLFASFDYGEIETAAARLASGASPKKEDGADG